MTIRTTSAISKPQSSDRMQVINMAACRFSFGTNDSLSLRHHCPDRSSISYNTRCNCSRGVLSGTELRRLSMWSPSYFGECRVECRRPCLQAKQEYCWSHRAHHRTRIVITHGVLDKSVWPSERRINSGSMACAPVSNL